jgi:hypothetical protein
MARNHRRAKGEAQTKNSTKKRFSCGRTSSTPKTFARELSGSIGGLHTPPTVLSVAMP